MVFSKKNRVALKRVFWVFIPAVIVLGFGVLFLAFYLIHHLAHPPRTQLYGSPRDFQVIMQKPMWSDEKWKNSDSTESVGWFLSRGRPAPAVLLTHAYGSNRSELLTLSFELWKAGYHVLVYDMRGHGESPTKWSGLGTYEKEDLLSAIRFLKGLKSEGGQELLDGRIGLYGVELGGYVSLAASAEDPMVKGVVVDSAYPDVSHFIKYRLENMVGNKSAWGKLLVESEWTNNLTGLAMQAYLMRRKDSNPAVDSVAKSSGRKFLFITAKDGSPQEAMTRAIHNQAKDPQQLLEVEQTRMKRLYDKTSSNYDARVVAFFREVIPSNPEKLGPISKASK